MSKNENQNINQNQENNSERIIWNPEEYAHDARHCLVYGNFKASIELFTKAIEINPANASYYYYRGMAYKKLKQLDLAKKDFQKAAELDPSILTGYELK